MTTTAPLPQGQALPAEDEPVVRVSVRELRMMTERVLLTTGVPAGSVVATRDVVVAAELHGRSGLAHLLADLSALRAPLPRPVATATDGGWVLKTAGGPLLAVAADLLDLAAIAPAPGTTATVTVPGAGDDWVMPALPFQAVRLGVRLRVDGDVMHVRAQAATNGPDAAETRALTYGHRVPLALWDRFVAEADLALTPDSPLSRTHAGDSLYGPDGEILAEAGEDEPAPGPGPAALPLPAAVTS